MKKYMKLLIAAIGALVLFLSLASCSGSSFYRDFHSAGADIDTDCQFSYITLDEVKAKRENGDKFVLFLGSSTDSSCVSKVEQIEAEAKACKYTGGLYFLSTTDITSSSTKSLEYIKALGTKNITGMVAVEYNGNEISFDTSKYDQNDEGDSCKIFAVYDDDKSISFVAIADYVFLYYTE